MIQQRQQDAWDGNHDSILDWLEEQGDDDDDDSLFVSSSGFATVEDSIAPWWRRLLPSDPLVVIVLTTVLVAALLHRILLLIARHRNSSARGLQKTEDSDMDRDEIRKRRLEKTATTTPASSAGDSPSSTSPVKKKPAVAESQQEQSQKDSSIESPSAGVPFLVKDPPPSTARHSKENGTAVMKKTDPPPPQPTARPDTDNDNITNKKKAKKILSPAGRLCQVLTDVFEVPLVPGDAATRHGSASPRVIVVSSLSTDSAADDLPQGVSTWLRGRSRVPHSDDDDDVRRWVRRHDRVLVNLRNPPPSSGPEIVTCLRLVQTWIWEQLSRRLTAEVTATVEDDDDDDDLPDLFQDDVDTTHDDDNNHSVGPCTQQWLTLLEDVSPSVNSTLLEGMLSHTTTATDPEACVTFWMTEILRRLCAAYEKPTAAPGTTTALVSRRWNAWMHLWTQCTLLRRAYTRRYLVETSRHAEIRGGDDGDTGRDLEGSIPFAVAVRGAAFCLPPARLSDGPASLFGRLVVRGMIPNDDEDERDQLGRWVFAPASGRAFHQTLEGARTLMRTARDFGASFWRVWIKTVDDKRQVFEWWRGVVRKK